MHAHVKPHLSQLVQPFKPGLHVRRKHKNKHKHKHKDVYMCNNISITWHRQAQKQPRFDSNMAENGNAWVTRLYADNLSLFFSFLSLRLCLCLGRPGLHVRRNDASISTSTREWKSFHSLVLVLMLASLLRRCKLGRRKHKHKRKHKTLMLASHRFTRRFLVLMLAYVVHVNQALDFPNQME